jgi:hypothetical protein
MDSLKKLINNDGSLCVLYDFFLFSDEVLFFAFSALAPASGLFVLHWNTNLGNPRRT